VIGGGSARSDAGLLCDVRGVVIVDSLVLSLFLILLLLSLVRLMDPLVMVCEVLGRLLRPFFFFFACLI